MKSLNILVSMKLAGQARRQNGYAMAALLVAMSIMAIMMTVAMPVWKQISTREKEEELVFRGEQYARAIGLFQRKFANAAPPSFDLLVEQRFLRKKYKDPITNDDFVPVMQIQNAPGTTASGARGSATPGGQTSVSAPLSTLGPGRGATTPPPRPQPGSQSGGITGVTSKSKDKSIRLYKGRNHYNEWQFVYTAPAGAPGAGGGGVPGQRGQGQRPGGPGQSTSPTSPFGQPPFGGPNPGRGRGPGPTSPPTPGRRGG
jgi:type II secretory pathway pseudopilin PulG